MNLIKLSFRLPHKHSVFGDLTKTYVQRIRSSTSLSSRRQICLLPTASCGRKIGSKRYAHTHKDAKTSLSLYNILY